MVWHLDVGSSHPGAGVGPKGWAVRPLKRYASWVQNVVRDVYKRQIIDLTCDMRDSEHRREVRDAINALPGVASDSVADQTFMSHIGGKVEIHSKVPLRNRDDLSRAYTPGVARVCTAIHDMPQKAHLLTMKANTVAVVSDGTAVLGLGDIGPEAALPVMEGKAVLFKEFGGVDAWPWCLSFGAVMPGARRSSSIQASI